MHEVNFSELTSKENKLRKAKEMLAFRLSGGVDSGTSYMKSSAYSEAHSDMPTGDESKADVIIMLHDFFDSPHIYQWMLFPDFYEWINFVLNNINYDKYNVYVKPHPNGMIGNEVVVDHLKAKYKQAKFIDKSTSNKVIMGYGFDYGLTVYGTVAHELAYNGVNVITCGSNPSSGYKFVHEVKSIDEYSMLLQNLESIELDINKNEIYEFFYMHYLYEREQGIYLPDLLCDYDDGFDRENVDSTILVDYIQKYHSGRFKGYEEVLDSIFINGGR
jgi:hypothetical protein